MQSLTQEIEKIIVAPSAYVNDNWLTYVPLPLSDEDRDLWQSFLKISPAPPAPVTWSEYPCVILASFGNYNIFQLISIVHINSFICYSYIHDNFCSLASLAGAKNKAKKLKQDSTMLTNLLAKAIS